MSKVLLLRTCAADGSAHGGFKWPLEVGAVVTAPDWWPEPKCGGGLHGLLWGEGDASLIPTDGERVWIAFEADDVVMIDASKAKCRTVRIVAVGSREVATQAVYRAAPNGTRVHYLSLTGGACSTLTGGYRSTLTGGDGSTLTGGRCSTLTGGYYSTLTGGFRSTLTGGDRSTLTGGDDSTLTGGDRSTLTGGDNSTLTGGGYSTLTGGNRSTLNGGDDSTLTGGDDSTLTGGYGSTLTGGYRSTLTGGYRSTLIWRVWDGRFFRITTAYVGEGGIEANKPYVLRDGKVEAA